MGCDLSSLTGSGEVSWKHPMQHLPNEETWPLFYPHLTDKKSEAERDEVTGLKDANSHLCGKSVGSATVCKHQVEPDPQHHLVAAPGAAPGRADRKHVDR